jgi:hypothetical protein
MELNTAAAKRKRIISLQDKKDSVLVFDWASLAF